MVPRAHVAKFYGRLRLIRSVLRASKFSVSNLIEIVILWVYYTIPFGFSLFRHFLASLFNFLNYFDWLRITDEGSVSEMRIWSILLIKPDLKWCIHLSRSLLKFGPGASNESASPVSMLHPLQVTHGNLSISVKLSSCVTANRLRLSNCAETV